MAHPCRAHRAPRLIRFLIALLVGAAAAGPAAAQETGAIAGAVIDARSQAPLADINVVVAGTLFGAATEADGTFRIEGMPPETYTVQVNAMGYRMARRAVDVVAGETAQVTFRLTPTVEQAAAGVVDPDTPALRPQASIDRRALREADVADLGAALRAVPGGGAARQGALGVGPVVRGLAGPQLGVFVDGARAFAGSPFRTGSPLEGLDPTMAERITVVKGPYALMQGGGALGAIRVETAEGGADGARAGTLHGSFRGNGSVAETAGGVEGQAFGASYRVQGAYRSGRDYATGAGASVPARYTAGGAHGRIDAPLTGVSTLSVRGAVQDQRDVAYAGRPLDAESVRSGYGSARYRLDRGAGPIRHLDVRAYATQSLHDLGLARRRAASLPAYSDERRAASASAEQKTLGAHAAARFAPIRGWRLTVGADAYRADQRGSWVGVLAGGFDPVMVVVETDVIQQNVGGFVNATRALGPIDLAGTARLDWMGADADQRGATLGGLPSVTTSAVDWSGALTLSTALTPQWTASAGIGSTTRPPSARERYAERFLAVGAPAQAEARGNPRLDPERSTQADAWLEGTFERGSIRLNGFVRRLDDYITLDPLPAADPLYPLSPEPVYRYVNGAATVYGVDASGRFAVNPLLTLSGRASYAWGEDETPPAPAPNVAPLVGAVSARVEAPFNDNLYLDVTTRFAAARDRVSRAHDEAATDGYAALDLRLGLALSSDASLVLRADNVTDAQYAHPLNASDPFTGSPVAEPGRTAGIGLRVAF